MEMGAQEVGAEAAQPQHELQPEAELRPDPGQPGPGPGPEPEPELEPEPHHTPAYRGKVVTRDAHRAATLTSERLELEAAASEAQAAAEEALAGGVPSVSGPQRQHLHSMVDAISDTDSDDNDNNDGRGWSARPTTPPTGLPSANPDQHDAGGKAGMTNQEEEAVVDLLRSRAVLQSELALLQEEERAQHASSGIDSAHLAIDTKSSIELDSSIEHMVVSSACPRSITAAEATGAEPVPQAAAAGATAPGFDKGASGRPPRLQSATRKAHQRMDIGEWTNRLQGADARRAEYLASRQRKARRAVNRGNLTDAFDPNKGDERTAAAGTRPVREPAGRETAARQQAWRVKTETPSAWAVAPGRGDIIADMGASGAIETRTALRPAMFDHPARSSRRDWHIRQNGTADNSIAGAKRKSPKFAAAAARKADIVAGRSAAAARGVNHKQRKAVVERPPSLAGWSEAPAIFRGDGGYNTVDVRDSVADADDLRAVMAQKMKEVNDRKNAALEAKAARLRSARIESEATHRRPVSARGSAVTAMAGAWRDGNEDCTADSLMRSAAAADAALRKLSEAAALADARRAQAVEARREAARAMVATVSARNGTLLDKDPGIGEREAAGVRMQASTRHPRPRFLAARRPNTPTSARSRPSEKQTVPEKEAQRLRQVTEKYESAAAVATQNGQFTTPAEGEVVASEASRDRYGDEG